MKSCRLLWEWEINSTCLLKYWQYFLYWHLFHNCDLAETNNQTQTSASVRNLGVLFDGDLSLEVHVKQLTARCYSPLRRIKSCRRALSRNASVTLINSLIVSRLDYCKSLLAGCNKQLVDKRHRVLNCAARVILRPSRARNSTATW